MLRYISRNRYLLARARADAAQMIIDARHNLQPPGMETESFLEKRYDPFWLGRPPGSWFASAMNRGHDGDEMVSELLYAPIS